MPTQVRLLSTTGRHGMAKETQEPCHRLCNRARLLGFPLIHGEPSHWQSKCFSLVTYGPTRYEEEVPPGKAAYGHCPTAPRREMRGAGWQDCFKIETGNECGGIAAPFPSDSQPPRFAGGALSSNEKGNVVAPWLDVRLGRD